MESVDYDPKGDPVYDSKQMQAQKLPAPIPGINAKKAWYEMTLDELMEAGYEPVKINFSPETGWEEQ
jgi:hypothetical protein